MMMPEHVPFHATTETAIKRFALPTDKFGRDLDWECMVGYPEVGTRRFKSDLAKLESLSSEGRSTAITI